MRIFFCIALFLFSTANMFAQDSEKLSFPFKIPWLPIAAFTNGLPGTLKKWKVLM